MELDHILDIKNLLCDQDEPILTELVRNHYLNYLEKQLMENFKSCYSGTEENERYKRSIKHTAEILEDKAVEASKMAQRYQRAMVKIIATVRRSTQENRLITPLEKAIVNADLIRTHNKETQTEAGLLELEINKSKTNPLQDKIELHQPETEQHELTLDEKIELFHKRFQNGSIYGPEYETNEQKPMHTKSHDNRNKYAHKQHRRHHHRPYKEKRQRKSTEIAGLSPASTILTPAKFLSETSSAKPKSIEVAETTMDNSNDSVALELAKMFSEEKTELDEIFGIDPNQEPDDPQICKILKEIEEAQINNEPQSVSYSKIVVSNDNTDNQNNVQITPNNIPKLSPPISTSLQKSSCKDLSKSIWPCELFMQRRKLSESLARLIEEDLRWHDIMKWKFQQLFGEDSDDEFAPCSPSIEMDEILMGSCVQRISPWIVKHLMKPMKHGLIGNRFIFKKLAKHIARSIIMENQYPDESIIKECVENYFCLHRAVMHLDDLQDVPSIS
ncbi:uncharacterized protein LOC142220880 [Haematobia irritans]|uniref:uncharacterized protein LOC142220880 n=1 Tax=Haematobia irritans TaxID=7368 RepID=UPI003F50B371